MKPRHARSRRLYLRWLFVPVAAALVWVGSSLGPALLEPSVDPVEARVAEWAREHGMGAAVTLAEQVVYLVNPTRQGGDLAGGIPTVAPVGATNHTAKPSAGASAPSTSTTSGRPLPVLPPIPPRVSPALKGEGEWQDLLVSNGRTVGRVAIVRPDSVHTAFSVSVVWIDPESVFFRLHPGTHVPSSDVLTGVPQLTKDELAVVLATFNSGFQMDDANGGYWQDGTSVAALKQGAASMVVTKDGHLTVGPWPGGKPASDVQAVRQNLVPMIHKGQVTAAVKNAKETWEWGGTVGNQAFVWRSAIGTRTDGSVIFVYGPALDIASLTQLMVDAGCAEAMELDINRTWTSFITYSQPGHKPKALSDGEITPADRYIKESSRDFVAVLPRTS